MVTISYLTYFFLLTWVHFSQYIIRITFSSYGGQNCIVTKLFSTYARRYRRAHAFLKRANLGLFYRLFLIFFKQTSLQFLQQMYVKKCPSSIHLSKECRQLSTVQRFTTKGR